MGAKRILVALSGGVDSAISAKILKETAKNASIEGVFMQNWDARIEEGQKCTVESDWHDAQRVAEHLRIPIHRVNFVRHYWNNVFSPSMEEYSQGRTPNPDLLCNREIKFGKLLEWAIEREFDQLATGHYSRLYQMNGEKFLQQAHDLHKDQSYFLSHVKRNLLERVCFPIGNLTKHQVKAMAVDCGMSFLTEKPESMGICFVGKRKKFTEFVSDFIKESVDRPFDVIDIDTGCKIAMKSGLQAVTLGQNLGISGLSGKIFCIKKDLDRHIIFASFNKRHPLLNPSQVLVQFDENLQLNREWTLRCSLRSSEKQGAPILRYERLATNLWRLHTSEPFFAPCPGQYAVLYRRIDEHTNIVVACGKIIEQRIPKKIESSL